jgi:hypothetical protein
MTSLCWKDRGASWPTCPCAKVELLALAICVLASFDELYIVPHKMGSYYYPEIKKVHANFNYSFVYIIT